MTLTAYIITRKRFRVHNENKQYPVLFIYTNNNQPYLTAISKNKIYFYQKKVFQKAKVLLSLCTPYRYIEKWRFGSMYSPQLEVSGKLRDAATLYRSKMLPVTIN